MIKEVTNINLNSIDKVKQFARIAQKTDSLMILSQNGSTDFIDAKSILGIFSMNLLTPFHLKIETDDANEIDKISEEVKQFQ